MGAAPELPEDLSPVLRHLEACWPQEGCGVLLRERQGGAWRLCTLRNAYDEWHAREPLRFPRSSRTAWLFEPREWLALLLEADARNEQVACVFHSHVDTGAYFSAEDRALAAPGGEPLLPHASHLVVAVHGGRARAATLFWWAEGRFLESPIFNTL